MIQSYDEINLSKQTRKNGISASDAGSEVLPANLQQIPPETFENSHEKNNLEDQQKSTFTDLDASSSNQTISTGKNFKTFHRIKNLCFR